MGAARGARRSSIERWHYATICTTMSSMKYRILPRHIARVSELIASPARKAKASVSLGHDLLGAVDEVAGKSGRSALIEHAVRRYLRHLVRRARHERELSLLNQHAAELNAAAERALADQAEPDPS